MKTRLTVAQCLDRVREEVQSWPGVRTVRHRHGGTEFRLEHGEIGHYHDGGLVDVPFPRVIRDQLVQAGLARPHHVLPQSGWVSYCVRSEEDVVRAVALLRMNYERQHHGKDPVITRALTTRPYLPTARAVRAVTEVYGD